MGIVIAVANQKGGVAKTTTSGALAAGLTQRGYKTLAIDLDPQGNLSYFLGADNETAITIYDVLKREESALAAIQKLSPCDCIPANIILAAAEQEISETGKEHRLREQLEPVIDNYDFIIIDTPPSLGVLTVNAFTAAQKVIITSSAGVFAAQGIRALNKTIQTVKKYCNRDLEIAGILITRYNPRSNLNKDIRQLTLSLSEEIGTKVYDTFIRNAVAIEEAQALKQDIYTYNSSSTVAMDYKSFVDEFIKDVMING